MFVGERTPSQRQDDAQKMRAEFLLYGQNRILRLIARSVPLETTLEELILFIEVRSPSSIGSVLVHDAGANVLRACAAPNLPSAVREAYAVVPIGPRVGSCGTAAFRRERVVVEDIATDPLWEGLSGPALANGLRACTSTPILSTDGVVLGTFAFYYPQPAAPSETDLELIEFAQDLAGIAIERDLQRRALLELNAELESRVEARTAELESFAYSVSHDLRAPLRAIEGRMGMLVEDAGDRLDEGCRAHVEAARRNALHMSRLIDGLLDFSRLSHLPLNKLLLQPAEIVQRAFVELNELTHGLEIHMRVDELPECRADAALLAQVFVNLLSNAVKYSRTRPSISIEVEAHTEQLEWQCSVRDHGVGFDMRHADRIFGVFERLHSAEEFEGSGIGLALVKRIVERHGGRVWAHGEPGVGSTFSIALPR